MVMACKYVNDVVIEAPYIITEDLIKSLNISKIVNVVTDEDAPLPEYAHIDQYEQAKKLGVYCEVAKNQNEVTIEKIAQRVLANKTALQKKFEKKKASENIYYANKSSGVAEMN